MNDIILNALKYALSYEDYRALHQEQVRDKLTSGTNQIDSLVEFTKLNNSRTRRWEKRYTPETNFANLNPSEKEIWLIISETWCGDAAQNIPVIQKIADQMPHVKTRYVFRDENLELMDKFLTNGGRSIPKLVRIIEESLEVLGTWGPRPAASGFLLEKYKNDEAYTKEMYSEDLAKWYVDDHGKSIEDEFAKLLDHQTVAS